MDDNYQIHTISFASCAQIASFPCSLISLYWFAWSMPAASLRQRAISAPRLRRSARQVARLEAALSVRLLERTTRSLRLTDAGADAYRHASDMLAAAHAASTVSEGTAATPRGLLRISAPKALARQVVHPLVLEFLRSHPEMDVQLMLLDRETDLIADNVDLALRVTDAPPPGWLHDR